MERGTPSHSHVMAAAAGEDAHRAMLRMAAALAKAGADLFGDRTLPDAARAEFAARGLTCRSSAMRDPVPLAEAAAPDGQVPNISRSYGKLPSGATAYFLKDNSSCPAIVTDEEIPENVQSLCAGEVNKFHRV
jgi:hypothetical protein